MHFEGIDAAPLSIDFRTTFRHASAQRAAGRSVWVGARTRDGATGYGEGCPREYVTGETLEGALRFVATHEREWRDALHDVESLRDWVRTHRDAIDANPAAWTAVELAVLDALGRSLGEPVEALLGRTRVAGRFQYSAVIGDASAEGFAAQLQRYVQAGFTSFKVKLVGDDARDAAKVDALSAAGVTPDAVRADANNCWHDVATAVRALTRLPFRFAAYEEPLRAGDTSGMQRLAATLERPIIVDESVCRAGQLDALAGDPAHWLVNVRVSKMGGLLRSLDIVDAARARGLRVVVGAHVGETSVLTRAALTVAQSARDILYAQEGAFGTHLLQRDVTDPPLMFGPRGVLDVDALDLAGRPGLGLDIDRGQTPGSDPKPA